MRILRTASSSERKPSAWIGYSKAGHGSDSVIEKSSPKGLNVLMASTLRFGAHDTPGYEMIRRDYILRMIEECIGALKRIGSFKQERRWQGASAAADEQLEKLMGADAQTLGRL